MIKRIEGKRLAGGADEVVWIYGMEGSQRATSGGNSVFREKRRGVP